MLILKNANICVFIDYLAFDNFLCNVSHILNFTCVIYFLIYSVDLKLYEFKIMCKFNNRIILETEITDRYKINLLYDNQKSEYAIQIKDGRCLMNFHHFFEESEKTAIKVNFYSKSLISK